MSRYETLEISSSDGGVAELTLSRPEVMNRFDEALVAELRAAIGELARDPSARAVVWSARGRHFSAGGDTDSMLAANSDHVQLMRQVDDGRALYRAFADFPKPLVVALHGHVFGVGTSLILTADAIVSAPKVQISDPHVQFGLVAGDGGCVSWPLHVPLIQAKRRLLWGEAISAEQAHRMGLVTELADTPDAVLPLARTLAEQVAALPPVAVQLTKRAFNKQLQSRIDDVFDLGFYLEAISTATSDVREAVAAFKEKRPGAWSGR
jgi:enoyl-CoA hydratase/carnithine racemase